MADEMSDADKIRSKRLAKLGAPIISTQAGEPSRSDASDQKQTSVSTLETSIPQPTSDHAPDATMSSSASAPAPSADEDTSAQPSITAPNQSNGDYHVNSTAKTPGTSSPLTRPRSRQSSRETLEGWEDRMLSAVFRMTVRTDASGNDLYLLQGVRAELEEQGAPLRLTIGVLDQAILEVASNLPDQRPLEYLLGCWKRVSKQVRAIKSGEEKDPKSDILKEARRLCFSYCIFAATMPDMFGMEPSSSNLLAPHLLVDPESDRGLCHDFLREAISRFPEDDSIKDILVDAIRQLSNDLSSMSMLDDYKPYVTALRMFLQYPQLVEALAQSPSFLSPDIAAHDIERNTLLGPFFSISPLQPQVAINYFSSFGTQHQSYINNSKNALRLTLQSHLLELNDIVDRFIKNKASRGSMLDWFAATINLNHKRRAMRVDPSTTSSDGFMVNVTTCLDQLCVPFMDATFSKIDKIDINYLRRSPRITIKDETKINADQQTSDNFYSTEAAGANNFISEVFFLTVAAHHYGTGATNSRVGQMKRELKYLQQDLEKFEAERPRYVNRPPQLRMFEAALKKLKDRIIQTNCSMLAIQGVMMDETMQGRSMQLMRYVITWLLRLVAPHRNFPVQGLSLPLPDEQPEAFRCLPEYFLEDIVDHFKFITRFMPHIITTTQSDELIMICIAFLRSSEYIKNPYLKAGLVTILFAGVWPVPGRPNGVLGDQLNGLAFAHQHLLHAVMKFYIECESTGTHTQFYDKFNIRYEIFQVIRCIWPNSVYRERLAREASVHPDFFVRFVNLLLNDVTYVLGESFESFREIHDLSEELKRPPAHWTEEERKEKEEKLSGAQNRAKGYMQLVNESVQMLGLFTEALADSFTMPEVVDRLAAMLNYNLDALVGSKQTNLKIENAEEYQFRPRQLLSEIVDVYLNLRNKPSFQLAVARDGRSFKPDNFAKATKILSQKGLKSPDEIEQWNQLSAVFIKTKEEDEQAEQDLGDVPDEFLDPLMATLMDDPVILPASKTVIDRATIRSHLLSDSTDPFNRSPLKIEDVIPDTELNRRIQAFKAEAKARRLGTGGAEKMDISAD